jgi:hypothetical protein
MPAARATRCTLVAERPFQFQLGRSAAVKRPAVRTACWSRRYPIPSTTARARRVGSGHFRRSVPRSTWPTRSPSSRSGTRQRPHALPGSTRRPARHLPVHEGIDDAVGREGAERVGRRHLVLIGQMTRGAGALEDSGAVGRRSRLRSRGPSAKWRRPSAAWRLRSGNWRLRRRRHGTSEKDGQGKHDTHQSSDDRSSRPTTVS